MVRIKEAIEYCEKHKQAYIDYMGGGVLGEQSYKALIEMLESGNIKPSDLFYYGMDFDE